MQRLIYFIILLGFTLNGSAQNFSNGHIDNAPFQFNNNTYKVTWIIEMVNMAY
ncbi:MAG: hypothetical protein HC803_07685 [Saprospiraceae bacterium]|nr:hypothetical protein [Saprospiraceae bacterium]